MKKSKKNGKWPPPTIKHRREDESLLSRSKIVTNYTMSSFRIFDKLTWQLSSFLGFLSLPQRCRVRFRWFPSVFWNQRRCSQETITEKWMSWTLHGKLSEKGLYCFYSVRVYFIHLTVILLEVFSILLILSTLVVLVTLKVKLEPSQ